MKVSPDRHAVTHGLPVVIRLFARWLVLAVAGLGAAAGLTAAPSVTVAGPARRVLAPGASATLSVSATGSGSLSYQWWRNGHPVGNGTGNLAIAGASEADAGWYLVDVTDSTGTVRSAPLFVTVAPNRTQIVAWTASSYSTLDWHGTEDAIAMAVNNVNQTILKRDGTMYRWGQTIAGVSDVVALSPTEAGTWALISNGDLVLVYNSGGMAPGPVNQVVQISSGQLHALALRKDGTVVAWGNNSMGQCNVPPGLDQVVAVAAGYSFSAALKRDGSVAIWGEDYEGIVSAPAWTGIAALAAGRDFLIGLKPDGTVVARGANYYGQCVVPAGLANVRFITAGWSRAVASTTDGQTFAWGEYAGVPPQLKNAWSAAFYYGYSSWTLRDASADTAPVVTVSPDNVTQQEAQSLTLTATTTGGGPYTYQWRKDGVALSAVTGATLSFPSLTPLNAGVYEVAVTNYLGTTTSAPVPLAVTELPAIGTSDPTYKVMLPGQSTTLAAVYSGPGAQSYQWIHNGRAVPGAAGPTLSLNAVDSSASGYYVTRIVDVAGVQYSPPVFVTVAPASTQVRAWGEWAAPVPAHWTNVLAVVSGGTGYADVLKNNGVVTAVGSRGGSASAIPAGLVAVVAVSSSRNHSLALRKDGTVVAWGANYFGQTNVPAGLNNVVAVAAGYGHSVALLNTGKVVSWGSGVGVPGGLLEVASIVAGADLTATVTDEGTVVAWGFESTYYSGLTDVALLVGCSENRNALVLKSSGAVVQLREFWSSAEAPATVIPPTLVNPRSLALADLHGLAAQADGTVVAWGNSQNGRIAVPANLTDAIAVSAGSAASYVVRDATADQVPAIVTQPTGQVLPEDGRLTLAVAATGAGPYTYQWRKNGTPIAGATADTFKLLDLTLADGADYDVVVTNYKGSTTSAVATVVVRALPVVTSLSPTRQVLAAGTNVDLAVTATGTGTLSYQWTRNGVPIAGATGSTLAIAGFTRRDAGRYGVAITDDHGTRYARAIFLFTAPGSGPAPVTMIRGWGRNNLNQISTPAGVTDAIAIAANSYNTLALRANGTAVTWGDYNWAVPAGLSNLVAIAVGQSHAAAVKSDGGLAAWGNSANGQTTVPGGLTDVVSVACGGGHTLALKSDGTVVVIGGVQSQGYYSYRLTDIPAAARDVVAIAARYYSNLALRADGKLIVWGGGDGTVSVLEYPTGIRDLAVSTNRLVLIHGDGSVTEWFGSQSKPVPPDLGPAVAVAAGGDGWPYSLMLQQDGTLRSWNDEGPLVIPDGMPTIQAIAAGLDFSLALRDASADTVPSLSSLGSQTVVEDEAATWTVGASGAGPFTYQWRKEGVPISGATSATFAVASARPADAGSYDVVVTNYKGSSTSNAAVLTVQAVPVVTLSTPSRQVVNPAGAVTLGIAATGTGALHYQWLHNGHVVAGATASSLGITNARLEDNGWYAVDVTDENGTRRSPPLFVAVVPIKTKLYVWGAPAGYGGALSHTLVLQKPALDDLIDVDADGNAAYGVRRDGTVVAWGTSALSPPGGLTGVVAVAATAQPFALKSDGTLVAWGPPPATGGMPAGLKNIVAIAGSDSTGFAVRSDGTIVGWSTATYSYGILDIPSGLDDVVDIAVGSGSVLALKRDGTVVSWGVSHASGWAVPSELAVADVVMISPGVVVERDGTLKAWGTHRGVRKPIMRVPISMTGKESGIVTLGNDGVIESVGTGFAETESRPAAQNLYQVRSGGGVFFGFAGEAAPLIVLSPRDGSWGETERKTLRAAATGAMPLSFQWRKNGVPIPGATAPNLLFDAVALNDVGQYDVVVTNSQGSATSATAAITVSPAPVVTGQTPARQVLRPGDMLALAVAGTGQGTLKYQWYHNNAPIPGATSASYTKAGVAAADAGWYAVELSDDVGRRRAPARFVLVAPHRTKVATWGGTQFFQTQPDDRGDTIAISAGAHRALLLRGDGTVAAFGTKRPQDAGIVSALTDVVAVAESVGAFSLALKSNGDVLAWGDNSSGQCNIPAGLKNVVAVAVGYRHAIALRNDGTVVTWGDNFYGQQDLPADLSDAVGIAAGDTFSIASKRDGTFVHGGGKNGGIYFANQTGVASVKAAGSNILVLKTDGTMVPLGRFHFSTNEPPLSLGPIQLVGAGAQHALALRQNGEVVGWGTNYYGETVAPAGLARVIALEAGGYYSVALVDDRPPNDVEFGVNGFPATCMGRTRVSFAQVVTNSGTNGWGAGFQLVLKQADGTIIASTPLTGTPSGASATVSVAFNVPATAGRHDYRLQALQEGVGWFGEELALSLDVTAPPAGSDFNADGQVDVAWQNTATGQRALWLLQGDFTARAVVSLGWVDPAWVIVATADFDADGIIDFLWQNAETGQRALWLMNGGGDFTPRQIVSLGWVDPAWSMVAATDFNRDNKIDILWQNSVSGQRALWLMNGGDFTPMQIVSLGWVDPAWSMAAATDFNADAKVDILWQNTTTGQRALWLMNGGDFTPTQIVSLGWVDPAWSMVATGDFNADGKVDIAWQNTTSGQRALWLMNGGDFTPLNVVNLGFVPTEWVIVP